VKVLEIVLAGTANLDCLCRHSGERCRTYQSSTTLPFLQRLCAFRISGSGFGLFTETKTRDE
jgi:hypothetical protein